MPAVTTPLRQIIRSADRFAVNAGWLESRWHFSFGHYNDPANTHFSALRVFNDDIVQPAGGFDTHPHRDAEIVSIVLDGKLAHQDSTGGKGEIGPDEVQAITAGRGLTHSEFNPSKTASVHFLQLWFLPRTKGNNPSYTQKSFADVPDHNAWRPLISDGRVPNTLTIDQDVVLYTTRLAAGHTITHAPGHSGNIPRSSYVFVITGEVTLADLTLKSGDQLRTNDTTPQLFSATTPSQLLLIDLP